LRKKLILAYGAVTEWSTSRQNLSSVWKNWLSRKF